MAVTSVLFHNSVLRASYGLVVCEIDQWTCYSYGHPTDTVTIMGKNHCYSPYGCIIAMAMATGILLPQLRACVWAQYVNFFTAYTFANANPEVLYTTINQLYHAYIHSPL